MLSKPYRLTEEDFGKIEAEGEISQFEDFGVTLILRGDEEPSRFGLIVSKKISKDAVGRNRIKRAIREAVRQSLWQTKKGASVLFLTKTTIVKKSTAEIMIEVREALAKLGLTK